MSWIDYFINWEKVAVILEEISQDKRDLTLEKKLNDQILRVIKKTYPNYLDVITKNKDRLRELNEKYSNEVRNKIADISLYLNPHKEYSQRNHCNPY